MLALQGDKMQRDRFPSGSKMETGYMGPYIWGGEGGLKTKLGLNFCPTVQI